MKMLLVFVLLGLATSGFAQTVCQTPNGEQALCVSVHQCPVLKKAYSNPSRQVKRFLDQSECGYDNSPWVCCGSVARFQSLESITATPPPVRTTTRPTPAPYQVKLTTADPRNHKNIGLLPMGRQCGVQVLGQNIVGGNEAQLDEFPWMALLENRKNGQSSGFWCGGMLINNRYVLTAAHCVTGEIIDVAGEVFRVRLGEHDKRTPTDCRLSIEGNEEFKECAEPHQDILVEEVIPHPVFNLTGEIFNDIALVRLVRPVVYQYNSSDIKRKTRVPIVSMEECRNKFAAYRRIIDQQICAGGTQGIDTCKWDSGSPIMAPVPNARPRRWYAEGIVSYGPRICGLHGWPAVYTRVSSYMNWILDNMKP